MDNHIVEKLKEKEWSMGHRQCPECCGHDESWLGHPLFLDSSKIGHKKDCLIALLLERFGREPLFIGEFVSDKKFESYVTEKGIFSTRQISIDK